MPVVEFPISTGFYVGRSLPQANLECKNLYVQLNEGGGLSKASLFGTAGIGSIATTGTIQQINRGSLEMGGVPYFVNGENLYRLNRTVSSGVESFSLDNLGAIPGTGRVSMAENGTQVMALVPGGNGYIYDGSFQQITAAGFTANGNPQHVVFLDSYFVVTTDTKKFITSALNDGLSWGALDFGTAAADPDPIVAPVVYGNQLFICGTKTIEVFQNIGGAGFPFQRVQGFVISTGLFAPFSLVNVGDITTDGTFMFIGGGVNESPGIHMFTGTSTAKVSTDAIDDILLTMTPEEIDAAFAMYYSESGAKFAVFTIKDRTFVYNITAREWHEMGSRIEFNGATSDTRWRVNSMSTAYNRVLVADSQDGRIGELSVNTYSEYGDEIIRTVSFLPFSNQGKPFFIPSIELTMESGVGDAGTPDPKIWMDRSLDGKTFKYPRTRSVGKIGEYTKRQIWRRNGRAARFEIFRFSMSDKVKIAILKIEADVRA